MGRWRHVALLAQELPQLLELARLGLEALEVRRLYLGLLRRELAFVRTAVRRLAGAAGMGAVAARLASAAPRAGSADLRR